MLSCPLFFSVWPIVLSEAPESLDAATAELLLTTILLDTINLDPTKSRGTAVDTEMADKVNHVLYKLIVKAQHCSVVYHHGNL